MYFCFAWGLQCLRFTYDWVGLFSLRPMVWITENVDAFWNTTCCAVPFFLIGIEGITSHKKRSRKSWGIRTIISMVAYFLELILAFFLSKEKWHFEFLVCTPVLIYNLLNWLLSFEGTFRNRTVPKVMRLSSLWIYCIHPFLIEAYGLVHASEGLRRFGAVLVISLLSSGVYVYIKLKGGFKNANNRVYSGV